MAPNPLQSAGAQSAKPPKFAPIFQSRFLTGLWLQRSPLRDPGTRVESIYYGGRQEALIAGTNIELTNELTLTRRPGTSAFSLQTVGEAVNSFYSFKTFTALTETIQVIMDGLTQIYVVSPASVTSIFTKSAGAGQASFLGINNTLYMGDGADQQAWNGVLGSAFRNWGISPGGITLTSAYAATGTSATSGGGGPQGPSFPSSGTDAGAGPSGSTPWTNPGSITASGGAVAFSNMTLQLGSGPINGGTDYIEASGFGFNVPLGASITGIAVTVSRYGSGGANNDGTVKDAALYLVKAGTIQTGTTNHASAANWPSSLTPTSYGNSADLWGNTLSPSDINNSGFGVALAASSHITTGSGPIVFGAVVDYITVIVYYTALPSLVWTNPTNVQGAPDGAYATAQPLSDVKTLQLFASNYGFGVTGTITGIQINVTGHVSAPASDTILYVQLQDNNGNAYGIQRLALVPSSSDTTMIFGSGSDLWGNSVIPLALVNSTNFGVQIVVSGNGQIFSIDSAQIVISASAVSATPTSTGVLSPVTGYKYVYEYSNSNAVAPVFSTATASTASTGAFTTKFVNVGVTASPDPQVTSIWVYRTLDGGATYFALPTNPYPNTTQTISDNNPDATLITTQIADVTGLNTIPPPGIAGMVFHMGRMWGFVNNVLYYAVGPDLGNVQGSPYEGWPRGNFFTFPSKVTKLVPNSVGLIVFTISDTYIVYGNASTLAASTGVTGLNVFYAAPFITGIGLLSQFACDVNGTTIYLNTADKQFLSIDPSSGVSEIGFAIGAPNIAYPNDPSLASFNPANSYVTWHVSGSTDKAVYVSDGTTGWFRCNTSQAPEGGFVWSPKANITGGCQAVQSIETSPGVHQLLIGPSTGGGSILVRNLNTFTDNGTTYPASFIMGNIVLAYPGQIAEIDFITCDYNRVGTSPVVSVLLNEINGVFSNISGYVHSDPPSLYGTTLAPATLYANRHDFAQTVAGGPPNPIYCRHLQIMVDFGNTDSVENEIFTLSLFGTYYVEK